MHTHSQFSVYQFDPKPYHLTGRPTVKKRSISSAFPHFDSPLWAILPFSISSHSLHSLIYSLFECLSNVLLIAIIVIGVIVASRRQTDISTSFMHKTTFISRITCAIEFQRISFQQLIILTNISRWFSLRSSCSFPLFLFPFCALSLSL